MLIRSIRFTLTLWYIFIFTAILTLFSIILYGMMSRSLEQNTEKVLTVTADGVTESIFAFWEGKWSIEEEEASKTLYRDIEKGRFSKLIQKWAEETDDIEDTEKPIRIIDLQGKLTATSKNFPQTLIPVDPNVMTEASLGKTIYEVLKVAEGSFRILTRPVIEEGHHLYNVQVVENIQAGETSLDHLKIWLFVLIPSTLFMASLIGWFLASMGLKPLAIMTEQAERIRAEHLHERLQVPETGDELEQMAKTFNLMLSRLEQSFKRLRQFSAAASHELRTPLTVMKGELEVTLRKLRTPEEYQAALKTHLLAIDDMSKIVEELLTLARSESTDFAIDWKIISISPLITQCINLMKPIAERKQISLTTEDTASENLFIRGEKRLLERLLINLIDNAIKHTPLGGKIVVSLWGEGNKVFLQVKDSGPGIPPESIKTIFDRFFSKTNETSQTTSGLGLGLCRWIAETHRASINVENLPEHGASFTVIFPHS